MTGTMKDSPLYAQVSQAHLENFKRKIVAADNEQLLQGILRTIDAAVDKKMIPAAERAQLHAAIDSRRKAMIS